MVLKIRWHLRNSSAYAGDLGILICLRHLFRSRAVTYRKFSFENTFFPVCLRNMFRVTIKYKYHGLGSGSGRLSVRHDLPIHQNNHITRQTLPHYLQTRGNGNNFRWRVADAAHKKIHGSEPQPPPPLDYQIKRNFASLS